jgi:hypothetical protein
MVLLSLDATDDICLNAIIMKGYRVLIGFVILLMVVFYSTNSSGLLIAISFEELVKRSDLIVIGTVESAQGRRGKDGKGMIYTIYEITVEEVVKGEVEGDKILVEAEGGHVPGDDIALWVEDQIELKAGERRLLYLNPAKSMVLEETVYHAYPRKEFVGEETEGLRRYIEKIRSIE